MAYVTKGSSVAQTAVIYDALSEGPIEGLVNGAASIRLNDNPVIGTDNNNIFSPQRSIDSGYTASTKILLDHNSPSIFSYSLTTDGEREIQILGASKRGINSANTLAGNNIIISSNTANISFASTDVAVAGSVPAYLRIDGAGPKGTQLVTKITQYINTSAVRVDIAPATTKTNTSMYLDLVDKVASYDAANNKATLTTGGGIDTANTIAILSSPTRATTDTPQYNYNNFGFAFRTGERDQPYLPTPAGIGSASSATAINAKLDQVAGTGYPTNSAFGLDVPSNNATASEVIQTSANMSVGNPGEIDAVKINIAFPSGCVSQKENGTIGEGFAEHRIFFGYSRDGGSTYTDTVVVGRATIATDTTSYHKNTRTKGVQSGVIQAKTKEAFNYTYLINTEEFQPYDAYRIKVQRLSPENQKENGWQQTNASQLNSIENIITDKLKYPYTAYAAVIVDAEDFGSIPNRGYEIYGMKVKVPTNYFPRYEKTAAGVRRSVPTYTRNISTGADTGAYVDWDGNFRGDLKEFDDLTNPVHIANSTSVFTDNPVWIFMDMLTNPRYGLGKYIDPEGTLAQLDKWTLYQIARYCDELVPDGKGGTEPRFTCNAYIAQNQDALKTLQQFTSVIRSMLVWYNGKVTLGANVQKGAVYTFTKGNVIGGEFGYSGTAGRFKHNQVRVTWNDPEDGYKQAVEVVEDIDEIQKAGKVTRKTVTAFGCTSQGQAHRYGKWHLFTEKLEKEVISFKTGINAGAILRPGDVINVQDADRDDTQLSGRVSVAQNSTTTVVYTDRDLSSTISASNNYQLHLIYPSGGAYLTQQTATINSVVYNHGDLVLVDDAAAAIDTEYKALNCKDDSGALVQLHWSEDVRIETKSISAYNASSVTVATAFSAAPEGEVIYVVSGATDLGVKVDGNMRQFIVTSVKENTKEMTFDINAAEYDIKKFDAVDRGYEIPELAPELRKPKRNEDVPAPTNVTAQVVPSGGNNSATDSGISGYDIVLSWTHPSSTRTDTDGNTLTDVYEHLAGYRIQHNVQTGKAYDANHDQFIKLDVDKQTSYTIENAVVGDEYILRVQTRDTSGKTSGYVQTKVDFNVSSLAPFQATLVSGGLNGSIVKGGLLSTVQNINSSNGTITFASGTYSYQPLNGAEPLAFAGANTNFTVASGFNNLANGEIGFLLFDYDANLARGSTRVDPLHAVHLHTDSTAIDADTEQPLSYTFLKRLGESSNDIVQASGTIALPKGSSTITGTNTAFTTDFETGDVVIVDVAGTTRFMSTVGYITSATSMEITSVPSRAYSGKNIYRQALRIDSSSDAVLAQVANNAGTFELTSFTNKIKIDNADEIGGNTITSVQIAGNAVTSASIAANSIGSAAIIAGSIGSSEIAANSIGSAAIIAGSIGSSEIAANAISAVNIVAGAIGASEIAANSIGTVAIAANAITSSEIAANSIGTVAIAANSITAAQLTSDAVGSFTVTANSITSAEIAANAVGSVQIAANTVNTAEIVSNSVTNASIAANSVDGTILLGNSVGTTQIAINSVNGIIIQSGAVDTDQIAGNAVTTVGIAANAIVNASVASNAINVDSIAANSIETAQLKSNSVTAAIIQANAIGTSEISANSVNAVIIAANSIESNQLKANSVNAVIIAANSINNNQLAINSVNSVVIQNNGVTGDNIAANSITAAKIVAGTITNAEINASAGITFAKISVANGDIDGAKISSNGNITNAMIGAVATSKLTGTISNAQIEANAITAAKIAANSIGSSEILTNAIGAIHIAANSIDTAEIKTGSIDDVHITAVATGKLTGTISNAQIAANAITSAKIAANQIGSAEILTNAIGSIHIAANSIDTAEIKSGSIDTIHIAANQITTALIASGNITNATISGNAITNAKISSSDSLTLTVGGGTTGGWTVGSNTFSSSNLSGGGNAAFTTAGISLGAAGYISAKQFYIDTSGNAKFKGTLEGDDVTVNGQLTLPSSGANVAGSTVGSWSTNVMDNKHIVSIGTGAGFYQGFVRLTGGTEYVKTISIQARTGSSTASEGTLIYETPRIDQYTAGNITEGRLHSSAQTANMPIAFTYTGSGNVSMFVRAQADSGPDTLGSAEARFIKFGTTDPLFSFANQTGVATSTAFYSNTQVVGGFAGTKTVSITDTSYTRYKIDGGSFGTANSNIANGSYINVEITSASTNATTRSSTITIGESSAGFEVTTTLGAGGGGGGCFVEGTPVVMADGSLKAIETVTAGESVKSFSHSSLSLEEDAWITWTTPEIGTGTFGTSTVETVTDAHAHDNYYWINYNLKVTGEHPMLAFKDAVFKFVRAEDLVVGDYLVLEDGTREEIFAMPNVRVACVTHNMDVEDQDTYVVKGGNGNGYIAHNVILEEEKP